MTKIDPNLTKENMMINSYFALISFMFYTVLLFFNFKILSSFLLLTTLFFIISSYHYELRTHQNKQFEEIQNTLFKIENNKK